MRQIINWLWPDKKQVISKNTIENVCFKGGGMKGHAFIGVDQAFTELELWPQIKRFIGSSAGAIFAGAAACRIPHTDMRNEIEATDFKKFEDSSWGVAGEGPRLLKSFGLYEGDYFYNWYRAILEKYIGDKDITLQGVYDKFNSELVITTTDLTKKKVVFLNRHDRPDLKLCDAVRMSMSIPVLYVPISEIDSDGLLHIFVDGGCTDNFPLNYFDSLYATPEEAFGKTIGFDLEIGDKPLDPQQYHDQTVHINNIIDLVTTLINTTIEVIERVRLTPQDKYRIVHINTWDYKGTDFTIGTDDIKKLSQSGYASTMDFFEKIPKE